MSNVNDANNGAQAAKENVDTSMAGETPEKLDKGKGKAAEQMPVDDSEESGEEEGDAEVEEPDEDNMEEIDSENIMGSRTRGKTIDYAEAAKQMDQDDDDEDDDDDYEDEEMKDN
ncbi:hypothetical protein D0869_08334 [Hortaea werneckii]|uniref:Histone chaperone domain-containing protein n=1 Tax=Hortaea werneckii TaxID=91943 RepID=A0A3M6WMC2_HORWE|nr:hypothetical protein KC324_g17718 [Hortaea werneckii]KAI7589385.1 hypothetical protein KC316_g3972 [Hortaea werneckii]RMX79420.1 hypothetical protein D0869_08334 [Hortaea werneckii]RMY01515.1 hypothetical protein D0868_08450 [Hortaea werneckii]